MIFYPTADTIYSTDINATYPKFPIRNFGYRSSLRLSWRKLERIFSDHGVEVSFPEGTAIFYRSGGVPPETVERLFLAEMVKAHPSLEVDELEIRPVSFAETEGLEVMGVEVSTPNLDRPNGSFRLHFGDGEKTLKSQSYRYKLEGTVEALVLTKTVMPDTLLDETNMKMAPVPFGDHRGSGLTRAHFGKIAAKGRIEAGTVLTGYRVRVKPDVAKNDRILVELREKGVQISFYATAEEEGMVGERIKVRDGKEREFTVRIVEPGKGEME